MYISISTTVSYIHIYYIHIGYIHIHIYVYTYLYLCLHVAYAYLYLHDRVVYTHTQIYMRVCRQKKTHMEKACLSQEGSVFVVNPATQIRFVFKSVFHFARVCP